MIKSFAYRKIESTNSRALSLWIQQAARGEALKPFVVVAEEQTGGKGHMGRRWPCPNGGICFSIAWPMVAQPDHYRGVTLAAALAVSDRLDELFNLNCKIKWPGDIQVNEKKLGGVLCEMHALEKPPLMIFGIGLNGNYSASQVAHNRFNHPTTLMDEVGEPIDLKSLLFEITITLDETLRNFDREGLAPIIPQVEMRLAWLEREVVLHGPGNVEIEGRLSGLDEYGRPILDVNGDFQSLEAGQIRLVR